MPSKRDICEVYIIHEYDAKRHFDAVFLLASEGKIRIKGFYIFSFPNFKIMMKGLLLVKPRLLSNEIGKIVDNFKIFLMLFLKKKLIILGMAPFDWRIIFFKFLKKRNRIIYFTSWPYWDGHAAVKKGSKYIKKLWFTFLNKIDVVTVTKRALSEIRHHGANARVIPHSVDTKKFHPLEGNQKRKMICLYVGRFASHKGVSIILDIIKEDLKNNEIDFWFVGEGPLIKNVKESAVVLNQVKYFGNLQCEALREVFRKSDCLILPSYRDGNWEEVFGIVIIEAFASGIPVIVTDCVGPREIVEDGINGFIVRQKDKYEIVNRIKYLMQNREKLDLMGRRARETAERKYDILKCASCWEAVLYDDKS